MALVLAIEPDLRQAAILKRIVRDKVKADVVIVDSRDAALEAMRTAVPDVMLLSALLSPRDEDELVAHLRTLDDADHLQTHTIPQLASSLADRPSGGGARGLLKAFRRKKDAEPAVAGCDPDLFAEEIRTFLDQAEQRKRERQEQLQYLADRQPDERPTTAKAVAPAAATAATSVPGSAPSWDSPFEWRRAEPPNQAENPSSLIPDPGSLIADPVSRIPHRESLIADPESPIADRESLIADRESLIADRESLIADPDSPIANPESAALASAESADSRVEEAPLDPDIERVEVKETQIGEAASAVARLVEARFAQAEQGEADAVVGEGHAEDAKDEADGATPAWQADESPIAAAATQADAVAEDEPAAVVAPVSAADEEVVEPEVAAVPVSSVPIDMHSTIDLDAVGTIELVELDPAEPEPALASEVEDEDEVELSLDSHENSQGVSVPFAEPALAVPALADSPIWNAGSGTVDSGIQDPIQDDEGFGIQDEGPGIQDQGLGIADSRLGIPDEGLGMRDSRLGPLATWARAERLGNAPLGHGSHHDPLDLISRLAIPGHVAGVTYARGVRIRRLRVAGARDRRTAGAKPSGPVILSRKALDEQRARQ